MILIVVHGVFVLSGNNNSISCLFIDLHEVSLFSPLLSEVSNFSLSLSLSFFAYSQKAKIINNIVSV